MSVQRNIIANYLASGWAAVVSLAFIPFYIRYLGIESYGLIGFFVTLQAWCFLFDLGLSAALNREMARHSAGAVSPQAIRDLLKSIEIICAAMACLMALAITLSSGMISTRWLKAQSLPVSTVTEAVLLMGLVIAFQSMTALYRSAILGLQHQVWLSGATAVAATLRGGGAVAVLAFGSPTIGAFFLFQCCVSAIESFVLGWYLRQELPESPERPKFSLEALQTIRQFATGLFATIVLATLLTQIDKLLLARLLPLDQFGYFTLAITVAGALSVLILPVYNVAYPRLSEMVALGDVDALAAQYHRFAQLLSVCIIPPALILCIFSETIVLLWTGQPATVREVAPLLSIWVVGTALNGLMYVPHAAQLAHGWPRLSTLLNAIAVVIMIPAVLVLVPRYGATSAAWIWVAINVGYVVFGVTAMHTRILAEEKWLWYGRDVLGPLAAAGLGAALLSVVHQGVPSLSRAAETAFLVGGVAILTLAAALAVPLGRQFLWRAGSNLWDTRAGQSQP
jgi:O-antigen/teichoic acid export membrane protein